MVAAIETPPESPLDCGIYLNRGKGGVYFWLPGGEESVLLTPAEAIDFGAALMQAAVRAVGAGR